MNDKKHNTKVNIEDAMKALDALYHTILKEEMSIIDRCNIFNEIEVGIKLEMIYKWLKALKKNANNKYDSYTIRNIAKLLGMTVKEPLLKSFFPSYEYPINSDRKLIMYNSIYYNCEAAADYWSQNIKNIDNYFNIIICLNIIRDVVLERLEMEYSDMMKLFDFDFNNCKLLDKFLNEFIGQGQHITFSKNIYNDINIDDLREIYHEFMS